MAVDASDPRYRWDYGLECFETSDPAMRRCLELAHLAAQTDIPILILGESGTGKTILAQAIHNSSRRAAKPFVSFSAAALSDTLLDSQLFGHERGAFTGADHRMRGKFELADGGTLFVDEIAEMSTAAQAKVLRAIEYGDFERLGSETVQRADVRLISATHVSIQHSVNAERFRKDLYYRISGLTLTIPPLRNRPADLRVLIGAEIARASRMQGKSIVGMDKEAAQMLFSYHWPGNLRELKTVIQAAVIMSREPVISASAIILGPMDAPMTDEDTPEPSSHEPRDLTLKNVEQGHIQRVLKKMAGNKRQAARVLGISRATLDRKLASGNGQGSRNGAMGSI